MFNFNFNSDYIILCSVLGANLLISFIVALVVWIRSRKYYKPLLKKDKNGNVINLHEIYDPFHPHDKLYFIQLWFGAFFCFLIKFISSFFIVVFVNWHIKLVSKIYKNYNTDPNQRKKMKNAVSCWSAIFLVMNGVWIRRKHLPYEEVYKKYLGEDYDFNDDRYSIILSNHIGFFDVVTCMRLFAPGFIAKSPVKNFWFVGPISQGLNCLFVDRTNQENKKLIFDQLVERQTSFYNGTLFSPMVNFPEGTCSCCRNILRFKKGPFFSLLPVKPMILKINQKSSFHLSVGASNVVLHYFKNLCHFVNTIEYTILPTIRPVDYLFEHNKELGKEKWEIYANVVRKIYAEIGGFIEVDMGMRDLNRYIKAMRTGVYDPLEDTDYEHKKNKKRNEEEKEINENKNENEISTKSEKINDNIDINENDEKKEKFLDDNNYDEDKEKIIEEENKEDIKEDKKDNTDEEENKEDKKDIINEEEKKDDKKEIGNKEENKKEEKKDKNDEEENKDENKKEEDIVLNEKKKIVEDKIVIE